MQRYIRGETSEWEMVIGLEIHAQIFSKSKLFSSSSVEFGAEPNHNVALFDLGMPGMLPTLNEVCVEQAIRTGLGLKAVINQYSVFDRKNYFYPDLPTGYQISQFLDPIVGKGEVIVQLEDGEKRIGITRIHLEQDAGKSLHDQDPSKSLIDLNRAGVGLMEIVTEPDIRSPEEAAECVKKLRAILRYLETSKADMEKGNLRCDANVSVRKKGEQRLGTRCEIKNVNSMKNIARAIEYEAKRQVEILESGGMIDQETRLFDASTGETRTMRSKEDAQDYRYFPDPDLLPLILSDETIERIRSTLPELPDEKKARYVKTFGLSDYDADVLVSDKQTSVYFEEVAKESNPVQAARWVTGELFAYLKKSDMSLNVCKVTAQQLGLLINLIDKQVISGKIAKQVFEIMFETGKSPEVIVEENGLKQVVDTGAIEAVIDRVLADNPDEVAAYRGGKDRLLGFFVGQVMKQTQGKANPAMVNELLKKKLG